MVGAGGGGGAWGAGVGRRSWCWWWWWWCMGRRRGQTVMVLVVVVVVHGAQAWADGHGAGGGGGGAWGAGVGRRSWCWWWCMRQADLAQLLPSVMQCAPQICERLGVRQCGPDLGREGVVKRVGWQGVSGNWARAGVLLWPGVLSVRTHRFVHQLPKLAQRWTPYSTTACLVPAQVTDATPCLLRPHTCEPVPAGLARGCSQHCLL